MLLILSFVFVIHVCTKEVILFHFFLSVIYTYIFILSVTDFPEQHIIFVTAVAIVISDWQLLCITIKVTVTLVLSLLAEPQPLS